MLVFLFLVGFFSKGNELVYTFVSNEISVFDKIPKIEKADKNIVLETYYGPLTAYGPDCVGCIGYTASGLNVLNGNIYYNDNEYGNLRIVAADKSLPFGTVVKISAIDGIDDEILAIVLDRGSAIGFNRLVYFDLLYPNEKATEYFGKRNATFEILRRGY